MAGSSFFAGINKSATRRSFAVISSIALLVPFLSDVAILSIHAKTIIPHSNARLNEPSSLISKTQITPASIRSTDLLKSKENLKPSRMSSAHAAEMNRALGHLPMSFEANHGQVDPRVKYVARGKGYSLFLTPTETVLALQPGSAPPRADTRKPLEQAQYSTIIRMQLAGANRSPSVKGKEPLPGIVNYFVGKNPAHWRTGIPTYARVEYEEVYPGVNLVYYGNQHQLEYDFVVSPGANPDLIKLAFDGVEKIDLNSQGNLLLRTENGVVQMHKPRVYQENGGTQKEILARYVIQHKNEVSFQVAAYDHRKPLVIDPTLLYSSFLGSASLDDGSAIAVDGFTNIFVVGGTYSTGFPVTVGVVRTAIVDQEAFIAKLDPTGSTLLYATFLGGSAQDFGNSIVVDFPGNAYIAGHTRSPDFPTTLGAAQTVFGGNRDAFITKLNPTGTSLLYSTFLGGSNEDAANEIVVDNSGNAFVTGSTKSSNFPTTGGVVQPAFGGDTDAFVAKLNAAGSAFLYSTYLGGSAEDVAKGIAVDSAGNAYVTGSTTSGNFPTTVGAFATALTGPRNAFVAKLNASASGLLYSTYLGGTASDEGQGVALDTAGSAYVTGFTTSPDFPTTPLAFQTGFAGNNDAFVTKLNTAGSGLVYSTFLGGSGFDFGIAISVDSAGNAYVVGTTSSANFPTTLGTVQAGLAGQYDAFVTKLDNTGTNLVVSTYLGGKDVDLGNGLFVDAGGNAYVTGTTFSMDFPTTLGVVQPTFADGPGNSDAFISRLSLGNPDMTLSEDSISFGGQVLGTSSAGRSITLTNKRTFVLNLINIFIDGDFAQTTTCGSTLPPLGTCTINVTFSPSAIGIRTGKILIVGTFGGGYQTISLSGSGITAGGADVLVFANGGGVKTTSGTGALSVTYGQVTALTQSPPVALANLGFTANGVLITEVGISASAAFKKTRLAVEFGSGVDNGVALVNPHNRPISILAELRSANGALFASTNLLMVSNGHLALFVSQMGFNLPSSFLGTLTLTSVDAFAAINLRSTTNGHGEQLMTSLPMADLNRTPSGTSLIFAQILDGGSAPTEFLLMNPSPSTISAGTMAFFDDSGNPMSADLGPGFGLVSSVNFSIPANGLAKFATTGAGSIRVGYAVVTSTSGPLPVGSAILTSAKGSFLSSLAGVPNSPRTTIAKLFVEVSSSPLSRSSGVAVVNRNGVTASLNLVLTGFDGSSRTSVPPIAANGHIAKMINELFPGLPQNFQGILTINSNVPVASLPLRITTNQRGEVILSTLPVADMNNLSSPAIYIPQIVNGGGYQSQIIFIDTSNTTSLIHIDFLNDSGQAAVLPLH